MPQEAVPKIEGHAAFYTHLQNGRVDEARMIGLENDRFVEKILFGRKYYEAPIITSRICGICPTIHNVTSTRAIEAACGIEPTKQTKELRKLMLCGQMIQSHSLHLYLLVLPDFVGASSSFELQKQHPDLFKNAILLKQYADRVLDVIGGRAVHPVSNVPGGFKHFPSKESLNELLKMTEPIIEIAEKTVRLFAGFQYPEVKQNLIYSALFDPEEYAFYEGDIQTTAGNRFQPKNYKSYIYEELKPYTRAKFGSLKGEEMTVNAMARMNLNRKQMHKNVKSLIDELNIGNSSGEFFFDNPFDNTIAQTLENYHFALRAKELIEYFLDHGIDKKEPVKPPQEFGIGTAGCEAPRGTLFHHYEVDKNGYITGCDLITPTVQSLTAMESDMKNMSPILATKSPSERKQLIEMLLRAYDPCITCATH